MKRLLCSLAIFASTGALAVNPGQPAPDFTLTDTAGKPVKLSDQ